MPGRLFVEEEGGRVRVSWQAAGQLRPEGGDWEPFEPPLSGEDLEDLRWYLEDYLRAPYAVYEDRGKEIEGRLPGWGEALFEAVFGKGREGGKTYQRAAGSDDWELWIASESPAILSLPWELLRDPDRPTPLALDISGIHRTVGTPQEAAAAPSGEALRVLMVIARPYGLRDVPYRTVARPLLKRLEPVQGRVELEVLRPPTFDDLRERLRRAKEEGEPFQILHFDGHGSFGGAGKLPEGVLLFETEAGSGEAVAAGDLASLLKVAEIPLLVLNACQSGMLSGAAPEAAVATRLLQEGAAAVVAMAYSIYAVAAAEFMAAFYESLFAGAPVARAVTAGRQQLRRQSLRPSPKGRLPLSDWIVPVHYARQELAFPGLRREERQGTLTLADALERVQQRGEAAARPEGEGVYLEGDIEAAEGRFFGRDREFQWLETALRTGHAVLLHGVGGTGKTELAKAFARWLRDSGGLDHPRVVFFHSFEPGLPSFGLDGVVASVGLRLYGSDFARLDPEPRAEAVLEALRHKRMLLVWDNFETVHSMPDPQGVTPPLDEKERKRVKGFLEAVRRTARGGVLLTSRSPEPWLGEELQRHEVLGLDPEDANEYAEALLAGRQKAVERRKERAFADLMDYLAGHPLSLRLILPRLEEKAPGKLLEALKGEAPSDFGDPEKEGRLESLDACVHYSFRQLPEEDRRLLPALTLFEGVADVKVLALLSQRAAAPARFLGVERERWEATLDRCVGNGLLTDLGIGMYRIHPALPRYLRWVWRTEAGEALADEREAATRASIRAHAVLGAFLLNQIQTARADTAMALLEVERRNLGAAASEALERKLFAEAQAVLQPLNELWMARGDLEEAQGWTDRCREAVEDATCEPPDPETAAGALWLFMVGAEAGRRWQAGRLVDAERLCDAIRRSLEGSTGEEAQNRLAVTYQQLGVLAQGRGDLLSAESWSRRSLDITEALADRPGMASSYYQLGRVAQDRGDLPSAESWLRRALEVYEDINDRPHLATVYHQLGVVAQERGDLPSAESWYRQSLEISVSLENRPAMASSYHELGRAAQGRGDLSSAESWYLRSLEIAEFVGDRPGMARSYHQLGRVAQERGDLSSAESWYRRSLELEESLGNRLGMALTYGQLGLLAERQGQTVAALEWTVRCVALFPEFPHPSTGPGPHHLVRLTGELGMEALEAAWRRVTGQKLPELVRSSVAQRLRG